MASWSAEKSEWTITRAIGGYEGQACYCIEPGVSQQTGDTLTQKDENFWDNYPDDYNDAISPYTIKLFIGRIMQYGYTGNLSTSWRSNNAGADDLCNLIATQLLMFKQCRQSTGREIGVFSLPKDGRIFINRSKK